MYEDVIAVTQNVDCKFRKYIKYLVCLGTTVDILEEEFRDVTAIPKEELWEMFELLLKKIEKTMNCIKELKLPPVKPHIVKATDAGPGVGSSNVEVKYRDVEMARIFNSDRVNRIHRARDDSRQNEAERSNACIDEALVDGGAMSWR
ncbi:RNA-directed DNA polymerase from transposon X-element [Paramuricea clavata]|uniref:RNA-directed DNA polymerase from transposon X-element n=1 Tax=Paramuricea clavata TaxID=317549 RepID=A0A7D9L194_PARCT|nr:RNA-directed DNA polymerase from transposon X-element [Paramuricea clavata]